MIQAFSLLRAVAWLKRLALAAERIASAQEELARISEYDWGLRTRHTKPKPAEFGLMDLDAIEKRLAQEQLERE